MAQQLIALFVYDLLCQLSDVSALIAVLRKIDFATAQLLVAQKYGSPEGADLTTGVIDIIFFFDLKAAKCENIAYTVAHRGPAAVTDMQRAGGVGTDKLDLNFALPAKRRCTVSTAGLVNLTQNRMPGLGFDKKIDKAGTGDFGFFQQLATIL